MNNPLFIVVQGQAVFHVRKNDGEPTSPIQNYWYSLRPDNQEPVDVRSLPGYTEPEHLPLGTFTPMERSNHWIGSLLNEAERVIREALTAGLFVSRRSS